MFAFLHPSAGKGAEHSPNGGDSEYELLIRALASPDGSVRHDARETLVHIGKPARPELEKALQDRRESVRWEAAKALEEMCDLDSAPALAVALGDTNGNVRWVAADALTRMGRLGLPAVLKALMQHADSRNLRECARHIVQAESRGELKEVLAPLLAALTGVAPASEVPHRAHAALHALRGERDHRRAS